MARVYAFCFASGLIEFGTTVPGGALPIARGNDKAVRNFVDPVARHGYRTKSVRGRPTKIPGSDHLLVPGVPEAPNEALKHAALERFIAWIAEHAPRNVAVLTRDHPGRQEAA